MTNYLTTLHNFDRPTWTPDFASIVTALDYKQQKYDANKTKLQTLYDQLDALKVRKDVDQEYIENRLQQVKEITNQYSYIDLSDDNFSNAILNNIGQVVDEKVENAVLSARLMDAEDKVFKEERAKNPKGYYEGNERYAKAMSDRARYFSTKESGDMYMGGANYMEYRDIHDKLNKKVQDILKNATHQQLLNGPNQGPFSSLSTYEWLSKPEVDAQLRATLDEKDYQQMKVFAWEKYGNASDEYLKDRKSEIDSEAINQIDDAIEKQKIGLTGDDITEDKRKEIQDSIAALENRKQQIQDNTYESIVSRGGRASVYNQLHENEFFDSYTKGFDYTPKEIKREIDQTRKAYVEFSETVRQHNFENQLARDKFEEDKDYHKKGLDLRLKQLEINAFKAGMTPGTNNQNGNNPNIVLGDGSGAPIKPEDIKLEGGLDGSQIAKRKASEAINNLESILDGKKITEQNQRQLAKDLSDANITKAKKEGKITILGRTLDISNTPQGIFNMSVVLKTKNQVLNPSPTQKAIVKSFATAVDDMTENLVNLSGKYSDWNVSENPAQMNLRIDGNKKSGFYVRQVKDKNYFATLLRKARTQGIDSLTDAEEKTLKYNVASLMVADPNSGFTNSQRMDLSKAIRTEILKELPADELDKIPTRAEDMQAAHKIAFIRAGGNPTYSHQNLEEVGINSSFLKDKLEAMLPGIKSSTPIGRQSAYTFSVPKGVADDVKKLQSWYVKLYKDKNKMSENEKTYVNKEIKRLEGKISGIGSAVNVEGVHGPEEYYPSAIKGMDAEYYSATGVEKQAKSGKDLYDKSLYAVNILDSELKKKYNLTENLGYDYSKNTKGYSDAVALASSVGLIDNASTYKGNVKIYVSKSDENGHPEKIKVAIPYKSTADHNESIKYREKEVNFSDLQSKWPQLGFKEKQETDFNTYFGENAAKMSLGNGTNHSEATYDHPFWGQAEVITTEAYQNGKLDVVNNAINAYDNGKYKFVLEPSSNKQNATYGVSIYKGGTKVYHYNSVDQKEISYDDAANIFINSENYEGEAFNAYLKSMIYGK